MSLLKEISVRQIFQSWYTSGYRSQHSTSDLIGWLKPAENIKLIKDVPHFAGLQRGATGLLPRTRLRQCTRAAPQATMLTAKRASHVTLTLMRG